VHEETVKIVDAQLSEMATQMAALDEFVTRARSQNDSHHAARVVSLSHLTASAQDGLTRAKIDANGCTATFGGFSESQVEQMTEIERLVSTLQDDTRPHLQELQANIMESTMTDYMPTGQTPQKREWTYPTQLSRTENHESIVARRRGLPDPALATTKTPSGSKTPGRSPRKQQTSPRKATASPSRPASPSKTKVFTDIQNPQKGKSSKGMQDHGHTISIPIDQIKAGLKEIDINLVPRPTSSSIGADERPVLIDFSKSIGSSGVGGHGPPPLKRHATTNAVVESKLPMKLPRSKSTVAAMATASGVENFSQSVGPPPVLSSGRRLRSSPPE